MTQLIDLIKEKLKIPKGRKYKITDKSLILISKLPKGQYDFEIPLNLNSYLNVINFQINELIQKQTVCEQKYKIKRKIQKDICIKIYKLLDPKTMKIHRTELSFGSYINILLKNTYDHIYRFCILWSHENQQWYFSKRINSYEVIMTEKELLNDINNLKGI